MSETPLREVKCCEECPLFRRDTGWYSVAGSHQGTSPLCVNHAERDYICRRVLEFELGGQQ